MGAKIKTTIGLLVLLLAAFAFGRYTTPAKVETKTVTIEIEKVKQDTHTDTKIVEVKKPDGTITKTTETKTDIVRTESKNEKTENTNQTIYNKQSVTVSVLAGYNYSGNELVYGASVSKPIIGPITIGLWGLTNRTFGASIGLQF